MDASDEESVALEDDSDSLPLKPPPMNDADD
jgi:hypothetical protein